MVESREGAHRCSRDGAWCSCVGSRSGGRNTSEPAVSLAPAVAWCSPVCVVNIKGPNRYCADNRVADVAGRDRSGVYDWSAVADLRSCGCPDCGGGHAGSDRLWETVTIFRATSQPGVSATRWEGALGVSLKAAPHIAAPLLPRALAP